MNMFNNLPQKIEINKREYFINTDFRYLIQFEQEMQDFERLNKEEQKNIILKVLKSFCPAFFNFEQDISLLNEKFLWFYQCGRTNYHKSSGSSTKKSQIYNWNYDDELVWGAFWDRRIDLTKDYVHWWKFNAILLTLPDDCEFNKVKGYRVYDGKEKNILDLKTYWTLPKSEKEQERIDRITKELMKY